MKPLVLITRPQPEADEFARAVRALGYDTLCEPLLEIRNFPVNCEGEYVAVLATSPQALNADLPKEIPLFVMGQASVEKARQLGFKTIFSADGDFTRFVALVAGNVPAGSHVLYLRGDVTRHDMKAALMGYEISDQIAYRAEAGHGLSLAAREALAQGCVHVVTLFSPRTAGLFQNFVQKEGLTEKMAGISLLCLSPAVLDSCDAFAWARTGVAPAVDSEGMLAALRNWIGSFS